MAGKARSSGAVVMTVRVWILAGLGVALMLLVPACSSGSARPGATSSHSPSEQRPHAVRLSAKVVGTAAVSVRVPAGWHGRVAGGKNAEIDLVAACGQRVITIRQADHLPARATTALSYAEREIARRGTKSGIASAPFPAQPLDGTPAVQVTWNSQDTAILAVHAARGYIVEASTRNESCAPDLPGYLAAVAGSWQWPNPGS
jgi:hypothetical protein